MSLDEFIESSKDYSIGQVSSRDVDINELSMSAGAWERWFAHHPSLASELAGYADKEGKKEVVKHIDRILRDRASDGADASENAKDELERTRERIVNEITGE